MTATKLTAGPILQVWVFIRGSFFSGNRRRIGIGRPDNRPGTLKPRFRVSDGCVAADTIAKLPMIAAVTVENRANEGMLLGPGSRVVLPPAETACSSGS